MARDEIVSFIFRNPVSAGTHLLWCLLAVYITGLLWRLSRGDRVRQLSTGAFGLSMVLLYGASGVTTLYLARICCSSSISAFSITAPSTS